MGEDTPKTPPPIPPAFGPFIPFLETLLVGFVSAFVGAAIDVLFAALLDADNVAFVVTRVDVIHAARVGLIVGSGSMFALIRNSPFGRKIWSDTQREIEREKLEEQGRIKP